MAGEDGKFFIKDCCCMANQYFVVHGGARKNFISKGQFDWAGLENENPDMPRKILSFAGARLKRTRDDQRHLPEELLPQGMPESDFRPRMVDVIEGTSTKTCKTRSWASLVPGSNARGTISATCRKSCCHRACPSLMILARLDPEWLTSLKH